MRHYSIAELEKIHSFRRRGTHLLAQREFILASFERQQLWALYYPDSDFKRWQNIIDSLANLKKEKSAHEAFDSLQNLDLKADEMVPVLIEMLKERNHSSHSFVVDLLAGFGTEASEAIPTFKSLFWKSKDFVLLRQLIQALCQVGPDSKDVISFIIQEVKHKPQLIMSFLSALPFLQIFPKDLTFFLKACLNANTNEEQIQAMSFCINLGTKAKPFIPLIVKKVKQEDEEIRVFALLTIARLLPETKGIIKALQPIVAKETNEREQKMIISVLETLELPLKKAIPILLKYLKGKDRFLRPLIVWILGELRAETPKVVASLERMKKEHGVKKYAFAALQKINERTPKKLK